MLCATSRVHAACHATSRTGHTVSRTCRLQAARSGSKARLQRTSARPPRQRPPRRSQLPCKNTNMQRAPSSPSETHISHEADSGRAPTSRRRRRSAVPSRPCCMLHVATKACRAFGPYRRRGGLRARERRSNGCHPRAAAPAAAAPPRRPATSGINSTLCRHNPTACAGAMLRSRHPSMVPLRPQRAGRRADADAYSRALRAAPHKGCRVTGCCCVLRKTHAPMQAACTSHGVCHVRVACHVYAVPRVSRARRIGECFACAHCTLQTVCRARLLASFLLECGNRGVIPGKLRCAHIRTCTTDCMDAHAHTPQTRARPNVSVSCRQSRRCAGMHACMCFCADACAYARMSGCGIIETAGRHVYVL